MSGTDEEITFTISKGATKLVVMVSVDDNATGGEMAQSGLMQANGKVFYGCNKIPVSYGNVVFDLSAAEVVGVVISQINPANNI